MWGYATGPSTPRRHSLWLTSDDSSAAEKPAASMRVTALGGQPCAAETLSAGAHCAWSAPPEGWVDSEADPAGCFSPRRRAMAAFVKSPV